MTLEESLKAIDAAESALEARDWNSFDAAHAESVVVHSPSTPEPTKGRQAHREVIQGLTTAFPDMKTERLSVFGSGDWISAEVLVTGTNTGPMKGPTGEDVPATNKSVRLHLLNIAQVVNGEIVEEHTYFDQLGFLGQLGLVPEE